MSTVDERFAFAGGLAARLPEPADFGLALAEGFARRIGIVSRRLGAAAQPARWAARAAFAASRATAAGHVCVPLAALAQRYDVPLAEVRDALAQSGVVAFGGVSRGAERPLVVDDDGRLYLGRYFDYEARLARALVERTGAGMGASTGVGAGICMDPDAGSGASPDARASANTDAQAGGVAAEGGEAGGGGGMLGGEPADALGARLTRFFGPACAGEVDWQRVAALVALTGRVTIVSGGPGTGKTTTVVGVIACLVDAQPDLRIALAAPTGKAAQRMQEALLARAGDLPAELAAKLPQTSYTLHRLLGGAPGGRFRHHRDNPLPYDLVVVDEASMIDVALAAHLLDALAPNARLVLLGDKDQLAAVEAGAVFAELSARPAFSAAMRARIAQALGIGEAAFAAALPDGFASGDRGQAAEVVRGVEVAGSADAKTADANATGTRRAVAVSGAAGPGAAGAAEAPEAAEAKRAGEVAGAPEMASGQRAAQPAAAGARTARTSRAAAGSDDRQGSLFAFDDEEAGPITPADTKTSDGPLAPAGAGDSVDPTGFPTERAFDDAGVAWIGDDELAWLDDAHFPTAGGESDALPLYAPPAFGAARGSHAASDQPPDAPIPVTAAAPAASAASAASTQMVAFAPLADCVVWLERNYRFGLDSPIGRLSLAIKRGAANEALAALSFDPGAAARFDEDAGERLSAATLARLAHGFRVYGDALRTALAAADPDPLPLFDALNRFRILCATRSGTRGADEINVLVAAQVRRAAHVPLAVGAHWFAGRPVMVTRNDYALGLFNGDIGIALPDARGALRVWFRGANGRLRAVSPAALPPHDTAFALTVHKSQGSEFDEAALVLPSAFNRVLSRELVYTAVTRARERVQVIGPRAVLAQAVATRTARDSGLAARIAHARRALDEER